jgi:hypothetical protein
MLTQKTTEPNQLTIKMVPWLGQSQPATTGRSSQGGATTSCAAGVFDHVHLVNFPGDGCVRFVRSLLFRGGSEKVPICVVGNKSDLSRVPGLADRPCFRAEEFEAGATSSHPRAGQEAG